ncbi:MAG TPA: apolipoprotein N-acyltransferase [Sphingomicrobium sp.]|jgi:apolipoprotein N-acyltransferase
MRRFPGVTALALGALSAFAFEPFGLWPLMPLALALLCELLSRAPSLKRALLLGWWFGVGNFTVGLNWIQFAFTFQDKMPHWLGYIAVVLLSLYLAVYPALAAGLAWRFGRRNPLALVLALAGGWAVTEWLRATMFTGFAWNPIGVVLTDTPWLNVATFIGTYGLSVLVALGGGALWLAARQRWGHALGLAAALGLLLALPAPLVPDQCCLRNFGGEETPPPRPMTEAQQQAFLRANQVFYDLRVVQPNIGQEDKWRAGFSEVAAQRLASLSAPSSNENPRLLLWPEAAVTEPLEDARTGEHQAFAEFERTRAARLLRRGDILLTGGIAFESNDGRRVTGAANSVFMVDGRGKVIGRYDKAHLVPYGEYLPMRPLLSAIGLSRLAPGDVDFNPGPGPRTLLTPGFGKVGIQICYEIIFSGQVVDRNNRPDFIFNPSNDAWFGRWGPPQHLAQAQLRAAEEGLPVLRSTPTGISALIDARGRVLKSLPWRAAGSFDTQLPMAAPHRTIFSRFGNLIPLSLGFLLIIAAIALGNRRRYSRT